ncbi:hypothetical protein PGB90_005541 [Kerria lacca]
MFGIKNVIINSLYRGLNFTNSLTASGLSTFPQPLCIQFTSVLMAQPMKKKKKTDPNILKLRTERKRKRLWKEIKRLTKQQKQLKPLDEIEVPYHLSDEPEKYERMKPILSTEILEERAELLRKWSVHKLRFHTKDLQIIDKLEAAQSHALDELKKESSELYEEAIKIDETLLPFTAEGPTETPPIKNYEIVDGEYIDVSRKWDPPKIPDLDKKVKQEMLKKIKEEAFKSEKKKN